MTHQPGVYVPLRALFLVILLGDELNKLLAFVQIPFCMFICVCL